MVERKSVVAHIHEWEENRAKGKREEERAWESGDGGGEYWIVEGKDERDMKEKEEKKINKSICHSLPYRGKFVIVL